MDIVLSKNGVKCAVKYLRVLMYKKNNEQNLSFLIDLILIDYCYTKIYYALPNIIAFLLNLS